MIKPLQKIAQILARKANIPGVAGDQEVIYYGLQFIVYNFVTFISVLFVAWIFDILPFTLAAYASSFSLRIFTGGRHAAGPGICFVFSVASLCLAGAFSRYLGHILPVNLLYILAALTIVFTLFCIIKYTPVIIASKSLSNARLKQQKIISLIVWGNWSTILFLQFAGIFRLNPGLAVAIALGMLIQDISVLPFPKGIFCNKERR